MLDTQITTGKASNVYPIILALTMHLLSVLSHAALLALPATAYQGKMIMGGVDINANTCGKTFPRDTWLVLLPPSVMKNDPAHPNHGSLTSAAAQLLVSPQT